MDFLFYESDYFSSILLAKIKIVNFVMLEEENALRIESSTKKKL
jgi:hypothetical protein